MKKHKHESEHGTSDKPAARNKNTYLLIKRAQTEKQQMQTKKAHANKNAALISQYNGSAPNLGRALLAERLS